MTVSVVALNREVPVSGCDVPVLGKSGTCTWCIAPDPHWSAWTMQQHSSEQGPSHGLVTTHERLAPRLRFESLGVQDGSEETLLTSACIAIFDETEVSNVVAP